VLINGAGGCVGPFAVQIAKAFGADVTAVDHADKLDMLRKLGADHVVNYLNEDVTDGTRHYDHILDIAATRSVFRWRRTLRPGGSYTLIARTVPGYVQAAIGGGMITAMSSTRMGVFPWRPNVRADLDVLGGLIERGLLKPLIDRRFRLDEAAAAFRYLQAGRALGKVIVSPA
jgi:NADPH:quinone reductase-like Zn-dependent oxidoreductase